MRNLLALPAAQAHNVVVPISTQDGDFDFEVLKDLFGEFFRCSGYRLDCDRVDRIGGGICGVLRQSHALVDDSEGTRTESLLQRVACYHFHLVVTLTRGNSIGRSW